MLEAKFGNCLETFRLNPNLHILIKKTKCILLVNYVRPSSIIFDIIVLYYLRNFLKLSLPTILDMLAWQMEESDDF